MSVLLPCECLAFAWGARDTTEKPRSEYLRKTSSKNALLKMPVPTVRVIRKFAASVGEGGMERGSAEWVMEKWAGQVLK